MTAKRKITVRVPVDLLETAQEATGQGTTATILQGLELVAASAAYKEVRKFRGKVRLSVPLSVLRDDDV